MHIKTTLVLQSLLTPQDVVQEEKPYIIQVVPL